MDKEQKLIEDRINELCNGQNMSHYALSYKSGVPLNTILHIANGTTKNPGIFTIMKLCDGFGISIQEFFDTEAFREYAKEIEE